MRSLTAKSAISIQKIFIVFFYWFNGIKQTFYVFANISFYWSIIPDNIFSSLLFSTVDITLGNI